MKLQSYFMGITLADREGFERAARTIQPKRLPSLEREPIMLRRNTEIGYATLRTPARAAVPTECNALSDSSMVCAATRFSQNRAKNAASRSQTIIA